ncbi:MAG: type II toxin-antitoxin system VapC family toxin [Fibromonadaceae bacterium]|jgi:predicted nucleic acid-binding protein|nr:type II toxin-antitoxin system VapC family toxin [Fibromonadaceae bacterium]
MYSYFDSSLLLAILFDEKRFDDAWLAWNSSKVRVSSILLRIEACISLQRHYKTNRHLFDADWLNKKEKTLNNLLDDVFYKPIEEHFGSAIAQNKALAGCKSLDAIHLATALYFEENSREQNIVLCSFDKNMLAVAKQLGFETFG